MMAQDETVTGLGYRLAKGVSWTQKDQHVFLIRSFPLKTISLHPIWKSALQLLSGGSFAPIEDVVALFEGSNGQRVERMLSDLMIRGFLEQQGTPDLTEFPKVTVIVPVHNRSQEIEACLKSIEKLSYPRDRLETIVVDDASTDDTPEVISRFPVRCITLKENRQAAFCRNLGAQKATGHILAFVDSDCLVSPLWLKELVPVFRDARVAVVGGRVEAWFRRSALDRYEAVNSSLIMGRHAMRSQQKNPAFYVPSCNMLVQSAVFLAVNGFQEELVVGEDVDLCWRIQDAGFEVAFEPRGSVYHKHRNQMRAFCARRFDYGTSEPLLQKRHKTRRKKMIFPEFPTLFTAAFASFFCSGRVFFLAICCAVLYWDIFKQRQIIRKKGLPVTIFQMSPAVFRGYLFFLYHLCAFISRYYLLSGVVMFFVWPIFSAFIISVNLVVGGVEYIIRKPRLHVLFFLFFFTLDQLSYQAGVWWGCLKEGNFGPVNPVLVFRRSFKRV